MKHIKNTLLAGALLLGFAVATVSHAQSYPEARHYSFSFLPSGITAVYVTNTLALTNLSTAGTAGTNVAGLVYTNSGTQVIVGSGDYQPLLNDVNLWIPRDGRFWNVATNDTLTAVYDIPANVSVTYSSGSGANAAVTFVMVPMADDTREVNADAWTWSFTAVASQVNTTISTNANWLQRWPGAKKLRIRRVVNADTDASSQVVITALQLNGYK